MSEAQRTINKDCRASESVQYLVAIASILPLHLRIPICLLSYPSNDIDGERDHRPTSERAVNPTILNLTHYTSETRRYCPLRSGRSQFRPNTNTDCSSQMDLAKCAESIAKDVHVVSASGASFNLRDYIGHCLTLELPHMALAIRATSAVGPERQDFQVVF